MHHQPWKILAPIDLASEAESRVDYAVRLAAGVGGELTLLFVLDPERRREYLRWPHNSVPPVAGRDVRRVVLEGPVAETVSRFADGMDADLIALGRSSRRRLPWRRSAAAAITSTTDLPVCFGSRALPARFDRLVCEVALDGEDGDLIETSVAFANRCGASLSLIHALTQGGEELLAFGAPLAPHRPLSEAVAGQRLRTLLAQIPGATGSVVSAPRRPALARQGADLVLVRRDAGVPGRLACPVISVSRARARGARVPAAEAEVLTFTP